MKNEQNQGVNIEKTSKNESFLMLKKFYLRTVMPKITGNEMKVLLFLIDSTEGWNQSEATLTNTRISDGSGIALNTVKIIIDKLLSYNLINAYSVIRKGIVMRVFSLQQDISKIILPTLKEKISSKVSNFFSSKAKKEVFKIDPIILNVKDTPCRELTPSQNSVPCQNSIVDPVNSRQDTLSILDSIKDINKKNINTYHDHKEKTMNDNEFKNFKSEELTQEQKELKIILEDEFGFYKSTSEKTLRNFSIDFLKDKINFVQDEMKNKNIGNAGAFLNKVLNNPQSFQDHKEQKSVKEIAASPVPIKPISQTKELEQKIIKFFYDQSLIQSKASLTALDEALSTLIDFSENQTVMNEFRELGITKTELEMIFKQKQVYPVGFVAKIKGFLASYTIEIQEVKIDMNLRQMGLSFFQSATKKAVEVTKSTVNKINSFGFDDNEPIPC